MGVCWVFGCPVAVDDARCVLQSGQRDGEHDGVPLLSPPRRRRSPSRAAALRPRPAEGRPKVAGPPGRATHIPLSLLRTGRGALHTTPSIPPALPARSDSCVDGASRGPQSSVELSPEYQPGLRAPLAPRPRASRAAGGTRVRPRLGRPSCETKIARARRTSARPALGVPRCAGDCKPTRKRDGHPHTRTVRCGASRWVQMATLQVGWLRRAAEKGTRA